jgi:outer membrane protein OmpA-like peptidoglycan-associated protein
MEIEEVFGQSAEQNIFSLFDIILGLSLLTLMVTFLFISIGSFFNKSEINTLETSENGSLSQKKAVIQTHHSSMIQQSGVTPLPLIQTNQNEDSETKVMPAVATQALNTQTEQVTQLQRDDISLSFQQKPLRRPNVQETIYDALLEEFEKDLPHWLAEIDRATLTVRFQNPDLFFDIGSSSLNQNYQNILGNFFPRYIKLLKKHEAAIETISIEGHSSSEWRGSSSKDIAYLKNMALSHARTRAVLEYCLLHPSVREDSAWLRGLLSANGLSSSRIIQEKGIEKLNSSRRVEFRIHTW